MSETSGPVTDAPETASAPPTVGFTRIGVARTIALNRTEVDAVVTHLGLPAPSALS